MANLLRRTYKDVRFELDRGASVDITETEWFKEISAMENDKRGIGKITAQKLGKALKCEYRRFL